MRFSHFLKQHPALRYATAILAVPVAILLRWSLIPVIGHGAEYITLFPAILVVAVLAGRNAAMVTALVGAPVAAYFFKPVHDVRVLADFTILIATAALAGWLVQQFRDLAAAAEQKSRELAESELFYRQTLESIPGMVFTTRPDGYCDFQSRQWVEYTGVPMEEHLGDGWNKLLHPDDRQRAMAVWKAAVRELTPYDLEYRIRRHDGHYEWFKVRGRPIRDVTGRIVRWFGVAVNIDVFRRTQEELLRLKNALEEQTKELQSIISIVSHDLRAPLLNIRGFSDVLKNDSRALRKLVGSTDPPPPVAAQLDEIIDDSRSS
jgi:PAS domain S-box-containing protein